MATLDIYPDNTAYIMKTDGARYGVCELGISVPNLSQAQVNESDPSLTVRCDVQQEAVTIHATGEDIKPVRLPISDNEVMLAAISSTYGDMHVEAMSEEWLGKIHRGYTMPLGWLILRATGAQVWFSPQGDAASKLRIMKLTSNEPIRREPIDPRLSHVVGAIGRLIAERVSTSPKLSASDNYFTGSRQSGDEGTMFSGLNSNKRRKT